MFDQALVNFSSLLELISFILEDSGDGVRVVSKCVLGQAYWYWLCTTCVYGSCFLLNPLAYMLYIDYDIIF